MKNMNNNQKYVVMDNKGNYVTGQWFSLSKVEMSLYDEKTADMIIGIGKIRGMKLQKIAYMGEI